MRGYVVTIALCFFVLAIIVSWFSIHELKLEQKLRKQAEHNFYELRRTTDKTAQEITLNKKQFEASFTNLSDSLKMQGFKIKNLLGLHQIVYRYLIDTVVITDTIEIEAGKSGAIYEWNYEGKCVSAIFSVSDSLTGGRFQISGTVPIDIIMQIDRPNRWFWRGLWNRSKWPTETTVTSPCEFEIEKNIKINIQ